MWYDVGYVPDLSVVECEGDDVVEHEVGVLQRDPAAAPAEDDEVLHAGQLQLQPGAGGGGGRGGQSHAQRQGARLPAGPHQEVLNINNM